MENQEQAAVCREPVGDVDDLIFADVEYSVSER